MRTARARSTAGATIIVALALLVASFAAVALQRSALVRVVETALSARVDDLTSLLADGVIPDQLSVQGEDDALVQVVDASGTVIAASANIEGEGPITSQKPAIGTRVSESRTLPIGEGQFQLVARSLEVDGQVFVVYAASSLESVNDAVATLGAILAVGIPALIGFVGLTVWFIVGSALHPVEAIRAEVASIGDRELGRRVPVPNTDDEIGRLAVTMNEMLSRLEHSSGLQRRFVADASHELRSPLAAIRSQLEVDLVHSAVANWPETGVGVLDETLRMQRLVEDLLLLARSDSGTLAHPTGAVDLDDVVFEQARRILADSSLEVDTSRVSGAQTSGDADAVGRLIRNLLENASRFAQHRIQIELGEQDGTVNLTVDDDGPGIPEQDRSRVLERFTRLDEARDRDHGGTGLGLSIADEIARHHGGSLVVEESPLGGTRVRVRLPTSDSVS